MIDVIKQIQKNKKWVSIYYDSDNGEYFDFGQILFVGKNELALRSLTLDAVNDGITIVPINNVFRIETDTQYAEKMMKLYASHVDNPWIPQLDEDDLTRSLLLEAQKAGKQVTIELLGNRELQLFGFVDELHENYAVLLQIDNYGHIDGKSYFLLDEVSALSSDTAESRRIGQLFCNTQTT